jgi:hypothetical protein
MSNGRVVTPGKTRSCPHCKATILESAAVCPGCQHHLRFDPAAASHRTPSRTPLRVEGTIRPTPEGGPCEYSVVLAIRNQRGQEIARQVVGVGVIQPTEERTFALTVEVFAATEAREVKSASPESPAQSEAKPAAVESRWGSRPQPAAAERRTTAKPADPPRPPWPLPDPRGARPAATPVEPRSSGASAGEPRGAPRSPAPSLTRATPASAAADARTGQRPAGASGAASPTISAGGAAAASQTPASTPGRSPKTADTRGDTKDQAKN